MDPNALLEQLRDAHAPEAIGWWPLAIGWWILGAVVIIALCTAGRAIYKHRQKTAWKRQALKEYQSLKQAYMTTPSSHHLTNIIVLLRRCVASTTQNRQTLSLVGQEWEEHLASPENCLNEKDIETLSQGHYKIDTPLLDGSALNRIEKWIKGQNV